MPTCWFLILILRPTSGCAERRRPGQITGADSARSVGEKLQPSKAEVWAAAYRLREKIAKVSGDSTADIREWRDNFDAHR